MGVESAYREGALLPVNHFKIAILIYAPIHDVKGKTVENGFHNGLLLLFVITELTLIGRAYVQP